MTRGRKPLADPPQELKLSIPSSVALQVEFRLADPLTGKPKHGARSRLITRLLREWLASWENPEESQEALTSQHKGRDNE